VAGNTFGRVFTVTSFGESHGPALGCVVDGCPPGLEITEAELQLDVDRRRPGTSKFTSQRHESDTVRILSGVFEGKTTGTPIALLVQNEDQRSRDYEKIKDRFRPGHADYTYQQKYGFRDYRGGGRSSARETVVRVAAGAIARKYLRERQGVNIHGYLAQLGPIVLQPVNSQAAYENPFFCPDPSRVQELEDFWLTHASRVVEGQYPGSHCRSKLALVADRHLGQIRPLLAGRVVFLFAELDVLGAKVNVLNYDFLVALELGILGQSVVINLHHLDPINPDLGLLAGFVVGFGLTTFLFRRQSSCRLVRLHGWLALFSPEAIILVA